MTILSKQNQLQYKSIRCAAILRCGVLIGLGFSLALTYPVRAQTFITLNLPNLVATPPAVAVSHLSDGRFIYGNANTLYLQTTFGSAGLTTFATPPGVDPSFVTVLSDTTALLGGGGGGPSSPIYQFNPSSPATPGYTRVPLAQDLQNFSAARAGSSSAYVAGSNGSGTNIFDGSDSAVTSVTLAGQSQVLVDHAGGFSAGLAVDNGGNLFVGDDDNDSVYKFTSAQVVNALANSHVLTFADGLLVHTFAADVVGSLAVDAQGRLWAAGFEADGLFWFNPASGASGSLTPEAPGGAYNVSAFSAGGSDYVSFLWQSGFAPNSQVVYGYNTVQNVPEPAASALLAAVAAGAAVWWQHRRRRTVGT